jgi:hypothetical protein
MYKASLYLTLLSTSFISRSAVKLLHECQPTKDSASSIDNSLTSIKATNHTVSTSPETLSGFDLDLPIVLSRVLLDYVFLTIREFE